MIDNILKLANHINVNTPVGAIHSLATAAYCYNCSAVNEQTIDTAQVITPAGAFPVSTNAYGDWVQGWI